MADDEGDFIAKLEMVDEQLDDLIPIAVGRGMEHVRTVSTELTPVRDGFLVGSADVTVHGNEAQLKFSGPYARRQHFELTWKHTKGQALYLEQPMRTEAGKVLDIIADTLGEAF